MKCFGCGVEKDPAVLEDDVPPLTVICCEGPGGVNGTGDWRHVVVCHACIERLDLDMWISRDCWEKIGPRVPFDALPAHTEATCGVAPPEDFAHVVVP